MQAVQHLEIRDEKVFIVGTALKAEIVAAGHVLAGMSVEAVAAHYHISLADVYAALTYFYDNREAIERKFAEAEAYVRDAGIDADRKIAEMRERLRRESP
ncbi:MAG: DUF433 domain-containing protein [Anaerolineae bacterium]|nr:DUF433 domain-containing protein [Anaerolineae bacterium]